jgi:spore coat polysaccharide biosynthesis protein SpsF
MKNITLITQIRTNSTRLTNKILLKINQIKIIDIFIERVKKLKNIDNFIIATTTNKCDDVIVEYCKQNNYNYFRGSELNVFERYRMCCEEYNVEHVCRLTSDNPLFDIENLDYMIKCYKNNDFDYLKTIGGADGVGVGEIFNMNILKQYEKEFTDEQKEHVTKYFYDNDSKFKIKYLLYLNFFDHKLFDKDYYFSYIRLTLDTQEDFNLIEKICNYYYNKIYDITFLDILNYLELNSNELTTNDNKYKMLYKKSFLVIKFKSISS